MNEQHHYRRRRRFVDKMIQGQLLWWLIAIESLLFTVGMLLIYADLQQVIEENIYRVHQQAATGRPILMKELLMIFPWIISSNLLLVVIVDRRWKKVVRAIVMQLQDILNRVKRLDLRIYPIQQVDHEVLQNAKAWIDKERDRHNGLHIKGETLPDSIDMSDVSEVHRARECLKAMAGLLPES